MAKYVNKANGTLKHKFLTKVYASRGFPRSLWVRGRQLTALSNSLLIILKITIYITKIFPIIFIAIENVNRIFLHICEVIMEKSGVLYKGFCLTV
jgi:hypothetical protein